MNDAQLIKVFCNGNTRVFNTLVDRWQHRIHCVAYRYFNNHDEAMEITQKTFIRVYKKIQSLEDPNRFAAWIYRIANNLCLDETKRAGRQRSTPMDELVYVSVSLSRYGNNLPKRVDLQIKKSVLEAVDKGNMSRKRAMEEINVREY